MPEIVAHSFFAQEVFDRLPSDMTTRMDVSLYRIGARGPDPLGVLRFWFPPVWRSEHGKSNQMHTSKAGAFFQSLAGEAKATEGTIRDNLFSYACGFLTHYFLDACCHPYVIFCTGLGPGTAGNHRSFEHALDKQILAQHGLSLRDRPVSRMILPSSGLPETLKQPIDRLCRDVFNWKNGWKTINAALRDEKRFVRIIEDPRGRFNRLISRVSANGTLRSLSYAENSYEKADIWNRQHRPWSHPYDGNLLFTESLEDLMDHALELATDAISDLFAYVYERSHYPDRIGNRHYESGFDTEDPRNMNQPRYHLLPR